MPDAAGNFPIVASLDPTSSTTNVTSSYFAANAGTNFVALCNVGAGTASCAFTLVQAKDSSGTSAKALDAGSKTIATGSTSGAFDFVTTGADAANGFKYVALKVTVTGTATLVGGTVVACSPPYAS